jgi:hypothetical protein
MRLFACLGLIACGVSACAHIPDHIRLEIDGGSIEIKKPPAPVEDAASG